MKKIISDLIKNKKVLILGFGREGRSTFKLLSEINNFKALAVADIKNFSDELPDNVQLIYGESYQKFLNDFDIVFKSPGIVLENPPSFYKCKITSQAELFLKKYGKRTIGITGTKGKSTISTLLFHILSTNNIPSVLVGNIGVPFFDVLDSINDGTDIICEFSSHQLEFNSYSPHIAVFSNIFEEHLDHYGTFEKYYDAKKNIYLHQSSDDILICCDSVYADIKDKKQKIFTIGYDKIGADISVFEDSFNCNNKKITVPVDKISLIGKHNIYNIAIVKFISDMFKITDEDFINSLKSYKALPHRLEKIGENNGIIFYDDSISTTCECSVAALKSLKNVGTILIGGMDRGINYKPLIDFLNDYEIDNIILMYDSGKRIYNLIMDSDFRNKDKVVYCDDLESAVKLAKEKTQKNKICLLSPASPSYGFFKNFEDRGNKFKKFTLFS